MGTQNFSVRWTGAVKPTLTGTYTFTTYSDDGAQLWVNDVQLVDDWTTQAATEFSGQIALEAGKKYNIKLEYFQGGGDAVCKLMWSANNLPKEVIPQSQLYPETVTTTTTAKREPQKVDAVLTVAPFQMQQDFAFLEKMQKKEDWNQSLATLETTGIPRGWLVLGPRSDKEFKLFARPKGLDPERTDDWTQLPLDESSKPFGANAWSRPADEEAGTTYVDMGQITGKDNQALGYARTEVIWPAAGPALIWFDDPGRAAVYVNGERVFNHDNEWRRGPFCVPVKMKEGVNVVKVKSGQNKGLWGFNFRLERNDSAWRIKLLERLMQLYPEEAASAHGAEARLEIARRLESQSGQATEALAAYQKARELFPENEEIKITVEEGLRRIQAATASAATVLPPAKEAEAKNKANDALNKAWQNVEQKYNNLIRQGSVTIADNALRDFIARYPNSDYAGTALVYRACIRQDYGFAEECRPYFERAMYEYPQNQRVMEFASQGLSFAQNFRAPRRLFETSHEIQSSLEAARRQLAAGNAGDVEKAVRNLSEVVRSGSGTLVRMSDGKVYTRHTGALEFIRQILAVLPPDLLAVYVKSVNKTSTENYNAANEIHNALGLEAVAGQFHFTPAAVLALNKSGNLKLDQGAYAEAASAFARLLKETHLSQSPTLLADAGLSEAMIDAKLAHALLRADESAAAHDAAAALQRDHAGVALKVAGIQATGAEFAHRIDTTIGALKARLNPALSETPTVLGNLKRNGAPLSAHAPEPGNEAWTWPVQQSGCLETARNRMRGPFAHLQSCPAAVDGTLFVTGVDTLQALEQKTGKVIWLQQWNAGELPWNNNQFTGYPLSCPSVAGGGVYLRVFEGKQSGLRCYASSDGVLRWSSVGSEKTKKMIWLSDPVVAYGQAIAVYLERNDDETCIHGVAALDARSGELRWKRPLVSGNTGIRMGNEYIASTFHLGPPAADDGVIYTPTGLGSMAAVNAATGDVVWLSGYPAMQINEPNRGNSNITDSVQSRIQKLLARAPASPVIAGDVVILAPKDAPGLIAFSRQNGELRWRNEILDYRFLAGTCEGNLLVVDDSVKAIRTATGTTAWEYALPNQAYGQPGYSGGVLYVPTKDSLCRIDARNGSALSSTPWIQRLGPIGGIIIADQRIIGMNERTIVAYGFKGSAEAKNK